MKEEIILFNTRRQKNKLKSLKVAKWRKDEWRMMKDEGWMMAKWQNKPKHLFYLNCWKEFQKMLKKANTEIER